MCRIISYSREELQKESLKERRDSNESDTSACEADPVDVSTHKTYGHDIDALQKPKPEKSTMACLGYIFNTKGCHYFKEGKSCPYSHNLGLCKKEADAARARLQSRQK